MPAPEIRIRRGRVDSGIAQVLVAGMYSGAGGGNSRNKRRLRWQGNVKAG